MDDVVLEGEYGQLLSCKHNFLGFWLYLGTTGEFGDIAWEVFAVCVTALFHRPWPSRNSVAPPPRSPVRELIL